MYSSGFVYAVNEHHNDLVMEIRKKGRRNVSNR